MAGYQPMTAGYGGNAVYTQQASYPYAAPTRTSVAAPAMPSIAYSNSSFYQSSAQYAPLTYTHSSAPPPITQGSSAQVTQHAAAPTSASFMAPMYTDFSTPLVLNSTTGTQYAVPPAVHSYVPQPAAAYTTTPEQAQTESVNYDFATEQQPANRQPETAQPALLTQTSGNIVNTQPPAMTQTSGVYTPGLPTVSSGYAVGAPIQTTTGVNMVSPPTVGGPALQAAPPVSSTPMDITFGAQSNSAISQAVPSMVAYPHHQISAFNAAPTLLTNVATPFNFTPMSTEAPADHAATQVDHAASAGGTREATSPSLKNGKSSNKSKKNADKCFYCC